MKEKKHLHHASAICNLAGALMKQIHSRVHASLHHS